MTNLLKKRGDFNVNLKNRESVSFFVFLILSIISAIYYAQLLLNPVYKGDTFAYISLLFIETYVIIQTIGAWLTMLYGNEEIRTAKYHQAKQEIVEKNMIEGGVDVFITTFNEPITIIEQTIKSVIAMDIEHSTYVLDDGNSDEIKALAKTLNVHYIARDTHENAKAGNINNGLAHSTGRYVVVFDADYMPKTNFLIETLPFFEDENIALVQTPQVYRNQNNLISKGAGGAQKIFYDVVLKGKNKFNSVFWLGTNAVFRREALDQIGGIYPHKSEDLFTSYKIHQLGWKSIYISQELALGLGPDTLEVYHNQQVRWASGGFHMFIKDNPLLKKLTIDQKIQYLLSSTFYFGGIVVLLLMLMPIFYLLFGIVPLFAPFKLWVVRYLPFFLMQFVVILMVLGRMNWHSYVLSINSFVAHIQALINTIFNKDVAWVASGAVKVRKSKLPIDFLWWHIVLLFLSILSIPVGLIYIDDLTVTIINVSWALLNVVLLGTFVIFNLTYEKNYA